MNDGSARVNRDAAIGKLTGKSTTALRLNSVVKWIVIGIVGLVISIASISLAIKVHRSNVSLSRSTTKTQPETTTNTYFLTSEWQGCDVSGYKLTVEIYRRSTRIEERIDDSHPFEVPFHSDKELGDNVKKVAWRLRPGEEGPVRVVCKLTAL